MTEPFSPPQFGDDSSLWGLGGKLPIAMRRDDAPARHAKADVPPCAATSPAHGGHDEAPGRRSRSGCATGAGEGFSASPNHLPSVSVSGAMRAPAGAGQRQPRASRLLSDNVFLCLL